MTNAQAIKSIKIGKDLAEKAIKAGCNIFLLGEMGIANTTVASAIVSSILKVNPKKVTGHGSNISDDKLKNKLKIIRRALKINDPNPDNVIDVLAKVGGFEFGAMAGVMLAAARHECVIILDGFNTAAAALIADGLDPNVSAYMIASHVGREPGHIAALEYLDHLPMFTLDIALSEAIGSSIVSRIFDRLTYIYVCDPEDDFDGDINDFKESAENEAEIFNAMLEQMGLSDLPDFQSIDEVDEYLEKNFGDALQINEVDLDFQLSDDQRLQPFTPPFSVNDFNIPRSYPMVVKIMGQE